MGPRDTGRGTKENKHPRENIREPGKDCGVNDRPLIAASLYVDLGESQQYFNLLERCVGHAQAT